MEALIKQRPMHRKLYNYQKSLERSFLSTNTVKAYLNAVNTYYNIYNDISSKSLESYKKYLETHYNPRSFNLHVIGLNRYLKYIGKSELKLQTIRFRQNSHLDNILSYHDYLKLKNLLKNDDDPKWFFIVWTLAATGVRISELVQLQTSHISRGFVDIQSKGNKVRRIYFPVLLQKQLLRWISQRGNDNTALFLNDKQEAISIRGITKGLERIAERYGFDKHQMHPHAFRHLFAKKFLESRSDISMLADLLGHESLDTTKIYLRMSSAEQQKIIDDVVKW